MLLSHNPADKLQTAQCEPAGTCLAQAVAMNKIESQLEGSRGLRKADLVQPFLLLVSLTRSRSAEGLSIGKKCCSQIPVLQSAYKHTYPGRCTFHRTFHCGSSF